jgi:excisionase family DNA binding protein
MKHDDGTTTMLSVDQLAARWGVHRQTIYKAIKDKNIVASQVGGRVLIARSHVEFIEQNGNVHKKSA